MNMTNVMYFANTEGQELWPQPPNIEQAACPSNPYPVAHQQMYPDPRYDEAVGQDNPNSPSLLETLLRHGKEAVSQDYVSCSGDKQEVPLDGSSMCNIPPQPPPYTPMSSTNRTSPVMGFIPDVGERVEQPEVQREPAQNYECYPAQQYPNNYVAPLMMAPVSPINYNMQYTYASYANNQDSEKNRPEINKELVKEQYRVDYPWMKSYSSGS
jgi:hypothetical protein